MKLTSPAFADGAPIPVKYTCDGANFSPPLEIAEVLSGTVSLALSCEDPDSPTGTWLHWLVWNIAADSSKIPETSAPAGAVEGQNSFGDIGYGGPCPGHGLHHYIFTVYGLGQVLNLSQLIARSDFATAIKDHIIDSAKLVGTYSRAS